jgi:hypothetical protein
VSNSAGYPNETLTLTAGQLLPEHPPWWYLPAWLGANLPLLISVLAILGAILAIRTLLCSRRLDDEHSLWRRPELGLLLVLQQAILLPVISVGGGAVIYDAARQHLYVFPAMAILAGVGAHRLWRRARSRPRAALRPALIAAALSAALVVPMAEQTLLFPYNYSYVNPLAGIDGVEGNWETDYWFASLPEAISRVPRGTRLRCSSSLLHASEPRAKPDFHICADGQFFPFEDRRGTDPASSPDRSKTWVISWARGDNRPPPYCEDAGSVRRWLRGESVTMSYVLSCDSERLREASPGRREVP